MVSKIAISISEELNKALDRLSKERSLSRSRLIEVCLRENPNIVKEISNYQLKEASICEECKEPFKSNDIKIDTPNHGIICLDCWSKQMGEFVEKHPVSDRES